jgi:membrane associated rhomboid family serine protease/Tfp pilus assembly protein PilF
MSRSKFYQVKRNVPDIAPTDAEPEISLWRDNKHPTPAIFTLIAINICVFVVMLSSTLIAGAAADVPPSWVSTLVAMPSNTLNWWGANTTSKTILEHQYWRLIASSFVHLNALHLAVNMYVLWDFTRLVEKFYGSAKYLVIYLVSAIGASIISLFFIDPTNVSTGASGAVFGTFGAMVAYFWIHRQHFPSRFTLLYQKIFFVFFVYSVACAYVFKDMDNAAHAGGFLVGLWTGLCVIPQAPGATAWRRIDLTRLAFVIVVLVIGLLADNKFISDNPRAQAEVEYDRAISLLQQKKYGEAVDYLDKAIALFPNNAAYFVDRAAAFSYLEKYDGALADCERALQLEPQNKRAIRQLAAAYHSLGNFQTAVEVYTRILATDTKSVVSYNNRAWSYDALGKYKEAVDDCTKALQLDAAATNAMDTRGVAFLLSGQYQDAQRDLDQHISLKPDEGAGYYHRALLFRKLGKDELAEQDLAKARKCDYKLEPWEKKFFGK